VHEITDRKRGELVRRTAERSLRVLFGASRSRVLFALRELTTTSELALELGLAPSTVSAHVRALDSAGVLDRVRRGRCVYYRLNSTGRALVEAVDGS
jgi:DNA-binding MarR family transcriptional regulator